MSLVSIAFEIGVGAWLVLVLMFLWSIERRLAEICEKNPQIAGESSQRP